MAKKGLLTLTALALLLVATTAFHDSRVLRLRSFRLASGRLAELLAGRKLLLLSDLHIAGKLSSQHRQALALAKRLAPDLIVLTGDYVRWGADGRSFQNARRFLSQLSAPLGVYAVLGDADQGGSRASCLLCHQHLPTATQPTPPGGHIHWLRNETARLATTKGTIAIIGLLPDSDPAPMLREIPARTPVILLSHSSRPFARLPREQEVLMLSGDTHGGQVLLPAVFWKAFRLKPDPAHIHGLFRHQAHTLYVTSGVGWSRLPVRLGVPAEVVLFRFAP